MATELAAAKKSVLKIKSIAMGVRYNTQWRIRDYLGDVADAVLRARGTPFSPKVFPQSLGEAYTHRLVNPETQDSLLISQSDTLLEMKVSTADFSELEQLAASFDRFVLQPLADLARLTDVLRYGFLARFEEIAPDAIVSPRERYRDPDLDLPRELAMRYVYRMGTEEAFTRRDVMDFRNIIITVSQENLGPVSLALDYQQYFEPMLSTDEWRARSFGKFMDGAIHYHRHRFADWVKRISLRDRAA